MHQHVGVDQPRPRVGNVTHEVHPLRNAQVPSLPLQRGLVLLLTEQWASDDEGFGRRVRERLGESAEEHVLALPRS